MTKEELINILFFQKNHTMNDYSDYFNIDYEKTVFDSMFRYDEKTKKIKYNEEDHNDDYMSLNEMIEFKNEKLFFFAWFYQFLYENGVIYDFIYNLISQTKKRVGSIAIYINLDELAKNLFVLSSSTLVTFEKNKFIFNVEEDEYYKRMKPLIDKWINFYQLYKDKMFI